ncbi:hypothetical protein CDCA_CDCA14G3888 [Cyanidium caldarium]|uniref:Nas2 N-terminal domain-containing protein n=1 Tax=Cyanidium caldarium TaxID=2771 RepID=A0AAV9J0J9_CYACA|nr:hypothetical protein CDCA_CDCA14G3888 [Cyanidium caldarium]|eukprot:ctg_859.g351
MGEALGEDRIPSIATQFRPLHSSLASMTQDEELRVRSLMREREHIEREIQQLVGALQGTPAGAHGPLVDADGYPRTDCDVVQIRHWRHRLAALHTDHAKVTQALEPLMQVMLGGPARAEAVLGNGRGVLLSEPVEEAVQGPEEISAVDANAPVFARFVEVTAGSPAAVAGIRVGDELVALGSCRRWVALAGALSDYRHQSIEVWVRRWDTEGDTATMPLLRLWLTPREWSGAGLLGARLVPLPPPTASE